METPCISEQIETAGINPQAQAVAECVEQECKVDIAELFEIFVGKDGNNNGGGNGAGAGAGALFRLRCALGSMSAVCSRAAMRPTPAPAGLPRSEI